MRLGPWPRARLREVTRDDVLAALDQLHGSQRHHALIALRSLFSRAKKNGTIFRDPTRSLKVGQHPYGVLQPLLADDIDRSVQAATTPAARGMVALAGVHAARAADMLTLRLDDVDLGNRRIVIAGRAHPLDDLTHRLLLDWLGHRAARWPNTANPHLLINHITATTTAPASGQGASLILHKQAATLAGRHPRTSAHRPDPRRSPCLRRRPTAPRLGLRPRHQDRHPLRRLRPATPDHIS